MLSKILVVASVSTTKETMEFAIIRKICNHMDMKPGTGLVVPMVRSAEAMVIVIAAGASVTLTLSTHA